MSENSVLYEFPITARMRSFLRLEHLINATETLVNRGENPVESLRLLHQLLDLLRHNDIKSELLRHIRWQEQELQKFTSSSPVDQEKLLKIVQEKQETIKKLDDYEFPTNDYTNNHFLNSVKLRLSVPGGICHFDLPQMNAWLHFSSETRDRSLKNWLKPFLVLKTALESSLSLTRMSADFSLQTAEKGYYSNKASAKKAGYSIIRIKLENRLPFYPEVSTGAQLFRIYFFEIDKIEARSYQMQRDLQFELACCTL